MSAIESTFGSSTTAWSVRFISVVSLKIAAVTSIGLSSDPKERHEPAQLLERRRLDLCERHAARDAVVRHQDARTTRYRDDREASAGGEPGAPEGTAIVDEILNVLDLDDARLQERGAVQGHRAAEIRRVRSGRALAMFGVPTFHMRIGFPANIAFSPMSSSRRASLRPST